MPNREQSIALDQAIIKGRIEAFEFLVNQFRCYADDNDAMIERKLTPRLTGLERSKTWRAAADDCVDYVNTQKKDLLP